MRIAAHLAVLRHQRIGRDFLAALARHQHLAFGDQRGREIEDDRLLALARNADAERRGGECAVDAAERRDQHAAAHIDEMDARPGLPPPPSRPIRRRGRHGRNSSGRWPKAPSPCISRCRARPPAAPWSGRSRYCPSRIASTGVSTTRFTVLSAKNMPVLLPFHIARHARDAVAVMTGQIGADQIFSDPPAFLFRATGGDENVGDERL